MGTCSASSSDPPLGSRALAQTLGVLREHVSENHPCVSTPSHPFSGGARSGASTLVGIACTHDLGSIRGKDRREDDYALVLDAGTKTVSPQTRSALASTAGGGDVGHCGRGGARWCGAACGCGIVSGWRWSLLSGRRGLDR